MKRIGLLAFLVMLAGAVSVEAQQVYLFRQREQMPYRDSSRQLLVRTGIQSAGSGYYETGVFVSPNGALAPYLIEDVRDTGNPTEVELLLYQLGFAQSWIQSVKNNLTRNGYAFVFYLNTGGYYRWLWITAN
jgi:hypothetical protein